MTTLAIQEFLRNGGSPQDLKTQLGISYKYHSQHSNLVLFKYNQKESPSNHPIVVECRGIILDQDDHWNVVAHGFNRFFNYGEGFAAEVDWKNCKVQEKVDGSLCLVFFYKNEWHVATTGMPDASGSTKCVGMSFAKYFWNTFTSITSLKTPTSENAKNFCFLFELTGPHNRIVVPYLTSGLTLLGGRDKRTWKEMQPNELAQFVPGVPIVREFPLQSIEDILATFKELSPLDQEGYVIVDAHFNRIKCKHPGYVSIHHTQDNWTDKTCVEVVRSGEVSEVTATVLKMYPQYQTMLEEAKTRYEKLISTIESVYTANQHCASQKEFALAVKHLPYSAVLFQLRAGKVANVREFLSEYRLDSLMQLLGYNLAAIEVDSNDDNES